MRYKFRIKPSTKLYHDLRKDQVLSHAVAPHLIFRLDRTKNYVLEDANEKAFEAYRKLDDRRKHQIEVIAFGRGWPDVREIVEVADKVKAFAEGVDIPVRDTPVKEVVTKEAGYREDAVGHSSREEGSVGGGRTVGKVQEPPSERPRRGRPPKNG
jgi:hypothetical protein